MNERDKAIFELGYQAGYRAGTTKNRRSDAAQLRAHLQVLAADVRWHLYQQIVELYYERNGARPVSIDFDSLPFEETAGVFAEEFRLEGGDRDTFAMFLCKMSEKNRRTAHHYLTLRHKGLSAADAAGKTERWGRFSP